MARDYNKTSTMTANVDTLFAALEKVEATRKRSEKFEILRALRDSPEGMLLSELVLWVFDPYVNFYITLSPKLLKKVSEGVGFAPTLLPNVAWMGLSELLKRLSTREVTGKAAREECTNLLRQTPPNLRPWFLKTINKKFAAGVGRSTIDKLFPNLVPWFDVQLCGKYEGGPVDRPYLVEPKMDGLRGLIGPFGKDGKLMAVSREGRPLFNVDHIIGAIGSEMWVFDGEFYAEDWNSSMSILKTQDIHPDANNINFHAFDVVKSDNFESKSLGDPLRTRKERLVDVMPAHSNVLIVEGIESNDPVEIDMVTRHYLEKGWEGAVLKDLESSYNFDRTDAWMKYKPMVDSDGPEQGVQEDVFKVEAVGIGYRNKMTMAVLDPHEMDDVKDPRYDLVIRQLFIDVGQGDNMCAVGGGFSLEMRKRLAQMYKKDPMSVLGHPVRVAFQGRTSDGMLRFPEFKGLATP